MHAKRGGKASSYFWEKLGVFSLQSDIMPESEKACNNPFHEIWSESDGGNVINLKAVASVLERYVEAEVGKKLLHKIINFAQHA